MTAAPLLCPVGHNTAQPHHHAPGGRLVTCRSQGPLHAYCAACEVESPLFLPPAHTSPHSLACDWWSALTPGARVRVHLACADQFGNWDRQ